MQLKDGRVGSEEEEEEDEDLTDDAKRRSTQHKAAFGPHLTNLTDLTGSGAHSQQPSSNFKLRGAKVYRSTPCISN